MLKQAHKKAFCYVLLDNVDQDEKGPAFSKEGFYVASVPAEAC